MDPDTYHFNTCHILGTHRVYHTVLSAIEVIFIPTTDPLGKHHDGFHFPDKGTRSDGVRDLSEVKQAGKRCSRDQNSRCVTCDMAIALIVSIHSINSPLRVIRGKESPAYQFCKVHNGPVIFTCCRDLGRYLRTLQGKLKPHKSIALSLPTSQLALDCIYPVNANKNKSQKHFSSRQLSQVHGVKNP